MAIVIKSGLDATGIKDGTAAAQASLKQDIGGALQQVQAKADEAGKSLKGMLDMGKIQAVAGSLGAFKSMLDQVGVSMLSLSKETEKAVSTTIALAQQGVAAGAAFGPWGAIAGAAIGTVVGALTAYGEELERVRKAQEDLAHKSLAESIARLDQQEQSIKDNEAAWDNYTIEVLKARGVSVDAVEALRASQQSLFDKEQEGRAAQLKGFNDEIAQLTITRNATNINTDEHKKAIDGLIAARQDAYKVQADIDAASAQHAVDLARIVKEQLPAAFEAADKASVEFSAAVDKIGAKPTLQRLESDITAAEDAVLDAQTAVENLRAELKKPQTDSGMQVLLINIKHASDDLKTAFDALLNAKTAKADKAADPPKTQGPKGKSFGEMAAEIESEQAEAMRRMAATQKATEEQAAIDGYLLIEKASDDKIQAASEAFAAQEELNTNAEQSAQEHEERVANTRMRLAQEAADAQKSTIQEVQDAMSASAKRIGDAMKGAFVDVGVGAAKTLFENIEQGKKLTEGLGASFEKLAAQQLKSIGETLVGEGLRTELEAARLLIQSAGLDPRGHALAGLGAIEIGAGLAMGASGALLGRRAGRGSAESTTTTNESLGSREAEASGPQQLGSVKIYLGPENGISLHADSSDNRAMSALGRSLNVVQGMGRKEPR